MHRRDTKGVVLVLVVKMSDLVESGDVIYVRESVLATNLAVVFSQLGERKLLVDADLRYPPAAFR